MGLKELNKQITRRKKIINFLLIFLSPTNKLMVALSQDLDKHLYKYQHYLFLKHKKQVHHREPVKLIA